MLSFLRSLFSRPTYGPTSTPSTSDTSGMSVSPQASSPASSDSLGSTPAVAREVAPTHAVLTSAGLVLRDAITPALSLLPERMDTDRARVMMLAISGQEAAFVHRWQVLNGGGKGPARGLWQFERGGGVTGVLNHASSLAHARRIALERVGAVTPDAVWQALEHDDVLAGVFARLLLWTDPLPLPALGDVENTWALYLRCWRPGAWTRGTESQRAALRAKFGGYYVTAVREVMP